MTHGNIQENLPSVVPRGTFRETETKEFTVLNYDDGSSSTQTVYQLDKAPIVSVESVTAVVNNIETSLQEGTDYAVIDDTGDGQPDSVDFSIGGKNPDDNTQFTVTYITKPVITRYLSAYNEQSTQVADSIDSAIASRQVNNATGSDLDQIGGLFGELGRRRGRSDQEYRAFLKTIVQSFSGRGTIPGLKFAIAAGIGTDSSNVIIIEDFDQTGYEIRLNNIDTTFLSSVVNDLAELADPSGVDLLSPPIIVIGGDIIQFNTTDTTVSAQTGLSGGQLNDGKI